MNLHIHPSESEVMHDMAHFICETANQSVESNGIFSWVLSGGSSPKRLFELLTSEAYADQMPWDKVRFFFGDERYVPHDHSESNFLMAKTAMLDPMDIPASHVYPVDTSKSPAQAASGYENDIRGFFGNNEPQFDLIMLGLGDDAHTASLFPHTDVLNKTKELVSEVYLPDKEVYRITFTQTLINAGRKVAFLTFGDKKADAVHHVLRDKTNTKAYPAQLIRPESGELYWFMDSAAAAKL